MKVAIMQPYLFPFIHYFRLIQAADLFVIYDDVAYIKQGFINRNTILSRELRPLRLTMPVAGASSHKYINELTVLPMRNPKILRTIAYAYHNAPAFDNVFPILENSVMCPEDNLSVYVSYGLRKIAEYLNIHTPMIASSDIQKDDSLHGQDRIIDICTRLGATSYINLSGGKSLYDADGFRSSGIELEFIDSKKDFSIIHYLMHGMRTLHNRNTIEWNANGSSYEQQRQETYSFSY
jgi:hypothetical protein